MEIIDLNEIDFEINEHDFFTFLKYKGKPFTGKVKDGRQITQFKNGNANGDSFEYNKTGQIIQHDVYLNGSSIRSKEWYSNGQLLLDSELGRVWNSKGKLVKDNEHWLYNNLKPKTKGNYFKEGIIYLAPNGEIVAEQKYINPEKDITKYNDTSLAKWYYEILVNPCPELSPEIYFTNSNTRFIWGWIWNIFKNDKQKATQILSKLTKHENLKIAEDAKEMLNDIKKTNFNYIKAKWL
ncbi:conserved protein of unknown function [Tenacibaculum sp. 190130A14a]|uniref:MORN repeat protein n=1 Tax=Tenacibaculum polynesiense TaxID=3137857 RepID=A0ABM9PD77_9FLAO